MNNFRKKIPIRRPNRKECKHFTSYRKTLREDFNYRCGYCDDSDKLRIRSFAIDHFVPRSPDGFKHDIASNYYYNLVYTCSHCNGAKKNKWPTKDPKLHNDAGKGFIDPVEKEYSDLFGRSKKGKIIASDPDNLLAQYIIDELDLWYPIHERMWKWEKKKRLEKETLEHLESTTDFEMKGEIEKEYLQVLRELNEIQNDVFVENE